MLIFLLEEMHTPVLLLALLVVLEAARIVLVDLERHAVRLVVAVVQQLRLLREVGFERFGVIGRRALHAVGRLLAPGSAHAAWCCVVQRGLQAGEIVLRRQGRPTKKRSRQDFAAVRHRSAGAG